MSLSLPTAKARLVEYLANFFLPFPSISVDAEKCNVALYAASDQMIFLCSLICMRPIAAPIKL
jgi:hypothetical protein